MRFWSEIILVISNQTHAVHLFDFEIMHLILGQIVLHSITIIILGLKGLIRLVK